MSLLLKIDKPRLDGAAGVTSIEYAILASLIAMAIIVTVTLLGVGLDELYDAVLNAIIDANS